MSCPICQDLQPPVIYKLQSKQVASILTSLASLRSSAYETNCQSCILIWQALVSQKGEAEWDNESSVELRIGLGIPLKISCVEGIHLELFMRPGKLEYVARLVLKMFGIDYYLVMLFYQLE